MDLEREREREREAQRGPRRFKVEGLGFRV